MNSSRPRLFSAALILAALAIALPARAAGVEVKDAWARATLPGQTVAGVYMQLRSDTGARVVAVKTPAAGSAEIHEMRHEGGVMKMRRLEALELPPGKTVTLKPGGEHIMLFDIRQPLKEGGVVELTLTVEQAGKRTELEVTAPVRPILADEEHKHH